MKNSAQKYFYNMVDVGQFKDLHEPANQNMTVEMATKFYNGMRFHRWSKMQQHGYDTLCATQRFHRQAKKR